MGCWQLPAHIKDWLARAPLHVDLHHSHLGTCSLHEESSAASMATSRPANPKVLRFPTNVAALKASWLDQWWDRAEDLSSV